MERYGLVGRRLGHSFSKAWFAERFRTEGIDAVYENFELKDVSEVRGLVASLPDLRGFNVTIPYKQVVLPELDYVEPQAIDIGAVNTVRIGIGHSLLGYNTDAPAFAEALRRLLYGRPKPSCALVLGTGGASLAVAAALREAAIEPHFVSRNPVAGMLSYADVTPGVVADHKLIVNTTPLGMWPDTETTPELPYLAITPAHACFDLVYNPDPTLFMRLASVQGAAVCSGLGMLRLQAEGSWLIWNGVKPNRIDYSTIRI